MYRTMPTRKDWEALKRDFFLSEFVDVSPWGRSKFGRKAVENSGTFSRRTKGWAEEKAVMAKKQTEMTVQKVLDSRSDKMAKALGEVYDHLVKNKDVYMSESAMGLETVWKIIMVANGQATTISRNDNTNHNIELEDSALNSLVNAAKDARAKRKKK